MRKWFCLAAICVFIVFGLAKAETFEFAPNEPKSVRMESNDDLGGFKIILEVLPASFLFSPNLDDFEAINEDEGEKITIEGIGSWIPSGRAGVSIGLDPMIVDVTGGGGYLWNNAFNGPFYLGDVAARFKLGRNFTIGPHAGILCFTGMNWEGGSTDGDSTGTEGDFDISDTTGWMVGLASTIRFGGDFHGYLNLDYVVKMDVEANNSWVLEDDSLDLSGFAVQFGVAFRF